MSKVRNATIANLTYTVGLLEELKSNINDTMRYIKNNADQWEDDTESQDSANESQKDDAEIVQ